MVEFHPKVIKKIVQENCEVMSTFRVTLRHIRETDSYKTH